MIKNPAAKFLLIILLLLIPSFSIKIVWAAEQTEPSLSAPIILSTAEIEENHGSQIMVNGLIEEESDVAVYINGTYSGAANVSKLSPILAKFYYISPVIASSRPFEVMVISKNQQNRLLSAPTSAQVRTVIEKSLFSSNQIQEVIKPNTPTKINPPRLSIPTSNNCVTKLTISGTADSKTITNIFIDNKFLTSLTSKTSSSVYAFNFSPTTSLVRGQHTVYAIAQDGAGKESSKSNLLSFCISSPQIITATSSAAESVNFSDNTDTPSSTASSSVFQKITTGLPPTNQHRGLFNIIIFIVFVIGLLLWMFLINRELGADKTESFKANNNEDKSTKNNDQSAADNNKKL